MSLVTKFVFEIVILSGPRKVDYFTSTMHELCDRFPSEVKHVVIGRWHKFQPWIRESNVHLHVMEDLELGFSRQIIISNSIRSYKRPSVSHAVHAPPSSSKMMSKSIHTDVFGSSTRSVISISWNVVLFWIVMWCPGQGHLRSTETNHSFVEADYQFCTQCMYFSSSTRAVVENALGAELNLSEGSKAI